MVKDKSKYSCKSTIYFDLDPEIIKETVNVTFIITKQTSLPMY